MEGLEPESGGLTVAESLCLWDRKLKNSKYFSGGLISWRPRPKLYRTYACTPVRILRIILSKIEEAQRVCVFVATEPCPNQRLWRRFWSGKGRRDWGKLMSGTPESGGLWGRDWYSGHSRWAGQCSGDAARVTGHGQVFTGRSGAGT